ncbi:MAG: 4Fe-4S dicluster domain-containing protein [Vicinamibacterales bacterium]
MSAHEKSARVDVAAPDRREFLRLSGIAAAGALASAGCQVPQETSVPFHDMPEALVDGLGRARFFRTVVHDSPVLVRTREGRPILVAPSPEDPSGRGLSVRHHAALMDLYDPDRARGPVSVRRGQGAPVGSSWTALAPDVVARLKAAGAKAVLLTGPLTSPAVSSAIAALGATTGMRHVVWAPMQQDAASIAWARAFGDPRVARPRLERVDLLVGLGAEFLDRPEDGLERDFAVRRAPESADGRGMSRFVQFEGRLTLTGANADQRVRVRDSQLARLGAALAHELIVVRQLGPLASDTTVAAALSPFAIETVAQSAGFEPSVLRSVANQLASASGRALVVAGGSASTAAGGHAIELAAILINITLGAFDAGLFEETPALAPAAGPAGLASLVEDMRGGRVDLLVVAGCNPVYDTPAGIGVEDALSKVGHIVSLNDRIDETTRLADVLLPTSHPFECWSDATLPRDLVAIQQPVVQALFDTRGLLDVLVDWAAACGDAGALAAARAAAAAAAATPIPNSATPPTSPAIAWHYLRAMWAARLALEPGSPAFETSWNEVLRTGSWRGAASVPTARVLAPAALALLNELPPTPQGLELQLYPHLALDDGRPGNNPWLQEFPDPITRITWGGAVSIAPRRFDEMQLQNGDLVEVDAGHGKIVAPAYRHAGMHSDQVALPLGLGRVACGLIGNQTGHNAFSLRQVVNGRLIAAGLPVSLRRVDGREPLALAQGSDVIDRERRPLVPTTTLTAYEADPQAGTEQPEGGPSAWAEHEYPNARWAMAIDLSRCDGCGKCVIGCQAENNVPVVGRQSMLDGREMSWLRIDRYYDAPRKDGQWDAEVWDGPLEVVEEPQTLFEPMLCQHCGNAPCESVCPFDATMHSEDGLNQQVYNRCAGTRYCANNCPFKVRRFNFWEYSQRQDSAFFRMLVPRIARHADLNARSPMQMKNNPEVTVRSRGVMEKCSFCVQRIRLARAEATRDGQPKDHLPDGAVVPACMEACPTHAITFGDVNAPDSRVTALASHPRAMKLLDALGVKPSVSYLTKVRNDKA